MDQLAISLDYCDDISFTNDCFCTINIENKHFFYDLLMSLQDGSTVGKLTVIYKTEKLTIGKSVSLINNLTSLDFNSKVIVSQISKRLSTFMSLPELLETRVTLENCAKQILADFKLYSDLNIDAQKVFSLNDIAKFILPNVIDDKNNILEKLADYIDLMISLSNIKVLILVHGKLYLDDDEIQNLLKYCLDRGIFLIFFESMDKSDVLKNECRLTIDNQLCAIHQTL